MSILSLDVGISSCGWAVFEDGRPVASGCIKTEKSKKKTVRTADDSADRAATVAMSLRAIVDAFSVVATLGELPSGGAQSAQAMKLMSLATGTVAATMAILDLPVEWTTPNEVKLAMCGKRNASKDEMMAAALKRFPGAPFPKTKGHFEHVADACGVYLALQHGNIVKMYSNKTKNEKGGRRLK